jgi:predicted RNA-binding Zn ribbon-like protein
LSAARSSDPLAFIRDFVNTLDRETGVDGLVPWLHTQGASRPRRREVVEAARVREAMRMLLLGHNGAVVDVAAAERVLDRAARRSGLHVRFRGSARFEPTRRGVDGVIGRILGAVATAATEGTWARLKACRAPDCAWAFVDSTRNHSRRWCSMAVCGNRAKGRAYRARTRRGTR